MIDFGKIVYLDVQKTGSSSVARFLRACSTLQQVARHPHAPAVQHRPDAFYFITVRNPMAQYISLFQYGLAGRGGMAARFRDAGMADYYQPNTVAFERWLRFMIDPENADFFGTRYRNTLPHMLGLQSYRFLALSFIKPGPTLRTAKTKDDLRALYTQKKLHSHVIKTESLNQDLENLLDSKVGAFFKPRKQVVSYLQNVKRAKKSAAVAGFQPNKISPDLIDEIKIREWFLYENFYPQEMIKHV
ncbi:MAG: hypothetical protein COB08_000625 [Rhodobacteraceae bacterium]|nr:hypothetical protein [Paracoccaceae bacterium]